MSSDPLQRIENDLAVMRVAMGNDLPFDRSHAALQILTGASGLPLLILPWFGLDAYVTQGMLMFVVLLLVAWVWQYRFAQSNRFQRPAVWQTARIEASSTLMIGGLMIAFFSWLAYLGSQLPDWNERFTNLLVPTVLFLLGIMGVTSVLFDRQRWPNLTWFVGLMLMGAAGPLCEIRSQAWMLYGAVISVGGISAGLLEFWQLNRTQVAHAD